jgi:hypothetical protein
MPMRTTWGVVLMVALGGGCATQSGATTQPSTGSSENQGSAVDANAMTPERQDAIERTFQRKTATLMDCWQKEYEKTHDRKFETDLTLGFDISPAGSPGNVRVLKASNRNADIESCVTQEIGGWTFPDGNATVPYMRTVHLGAQF